MATAKATSIPRQTIQTWTKQEWWLEEIGKIRQQISEEILAQNTEITIKAGKEILNRIEHGDTQIVQGKPVLVPVKTRDLSISRGIAIDKTIEFGMSKPAELKSESLEDLLEQFRAISRAIHRDEKVVAEQ